MTHSARASASLRALVEADPAIAALSLWCAHRDRAQPLAAVTEGETIHYGPAFEALPPHEAMGLAAHHILHAALRHGARMGAMAARMGEGFDRPLWGMAADAIVNEALLEAGFALPRPALRLTGLLAAALGQVVTPRVALAEWDADRLYTRLKAGGEGAVSRAKAHAAAEGFADDLSPAMAEGEPQKAEADWRAHLTRAMEAGRIAGRGIGMVARGMADLPEARTPWEVLLRGLVMRALLPLPRQSYARPARAFLAMEAEARASGGPMPAFQPGLARAAPAPRLVVALDTSSSIDEARLEIFLSEIMRIARRITAEIHLIAFDEAPAPPLRLNPAAWAAQVPAFRRDGGTAFPPALTAAAALRPALIVVLTDLEGDPGLDPRCPVLWAVPDAAGLAPPFGRLLSLAR